MNWSQIQFEENYLGQPVPEWNFSFELNNGAPQPAQTNNPALSSPSSIEEYGASVPLCRKIKLCWGESICVHSVSVCWTSYPVVLDFVYLALAGVAVRRAPNVRVFCINSRRKFFALPSTARDVDCRRRSSHDAAGEKNALTLLPKNNAMNKKEIIVVLDAIAIVKANSIVASTSIDCNLMLIGPAAAVCLCTAFYDAMKIDT